MTSQYFSRSWLIAAALLNLVLTAPAAAQSAHQVLVLKSFERDPWTVYADIFRAELSRQSPEPVNFIEVSIQPSPYGPPPQEAPVVEYLLATLAQQRVDLVVAIGAPAATFAQKYREQLFPSTPILHTGIDSRVLSSQALTASETVVAIALDLPRLIENMLQVFPATDTVFVVTGSSQNESFWRNQLAQAFDQFKTRPSIGWLHDRSFAEILQQAATLPPRSVILYATMTLDGKGVFQSERRALDQLRSVANAPIFGIFDYQLGRGIVGGPLMSADQLGLKGAGVAVRLLHGESPANIRTPHQEPDRPTYDWRELQRWGVTESQLPPRSTVLFRQLTAWDRYRSYIIVAALIVGLQSALIAGLVVQRRWRRRSELALRESEERFRLMADGSPVMIWTARPDMATDFFNKTVLEFTGLQMDQLLGDGWLQRVHPDDVDPCLKSYVPAYEARRPFEMEYRIRRADGTYRWVLDTGVPRYGPNGAFVGYIGSAFDITERKDMEQSLLDNQDALQEAYEQNQDLVGRLINAQEAERSRIARDLHDDLSQQLAALALMMSGLKRTVGKSGAQAEVDRALSLLQDRTTALADSVRNLSHELHPSALEYGGLVAALRRHCEDIGRNHHLTVMFHADDGLDSFEPKIALCFFRVTQEALTNAVRHARARTVVVRLTRTSDTVDLTVMDDGVGFADGKRSRSGLGLRSIAERVRLTRGIVTVDSRPGHGTTLLVSIPRAATPLHHLRES